MDRQGSKLSHYRRCHVCGAVTERNERVESCESCGKTIVPFFYFDEAVQPGYVDNQIRPIYNRGEVRPVIGLSCYWPDFDPGSDNRSER